MLFAECGVRERDRSGWKLASPPVLVHPGDPASMLEGESTRFSSGSAGAPGSPGLGRLEEVEETMPEAATELNSPLFCTDFRLREAPKSVEVEWLFSPSGW